MITIDKKYENGIVVFQLANETIQAYITNYGGTILNIFVPDQNNQPTDCILGFETVYDYDKRDGTYLNACVGRVANRIANGTFTLNDIEYTLIQNNGPNTLHGGVEGFSYKIFDYKIENDQLQLHYTSPNLEEGFPGQLEFYVIYSLENNALKVEYQATTDQDTIANFTNHAYFNLNGTTSYVGNHTLQIQASHFGCVDSNGLYNGEIRPVENTPMDFQTSQTLDTCFHSQYDQLEIGHGLDHPFIFDAKENQVQLYSPKTGIELCVSTTYPLAQIYSANFLNGQKAKDGLYMQPKDAICIETQYMPDSIHKEENSKVILRKGELYKEVTLYKFRNRHASK